MFSLLVFATAGDRVSAAEHFFHRPCRTNYVPTGRDSERHFIPRGIYDWLRFPCIPRLGAIGCVNRLSDHDGPLIA